MTPAVPWLTVGFTLLIIPVPRVAFCSSGGLVKIWLVIPHMAQARLRKTDPGYEAVKSRSDESIILDCEDFSCRRLFQWLEIHFRQHTTPWNERYTSISAAALLLPHSPPRYPACIATHELSLDAWLHQASVLPCMHTPKAASIGVSKKDKVPAWVISHFLILPKRTGLIPVPARVSSPEYSQINSLSVFKHARHYSAGHAAVI